MLVSATADSARRSASHTTWHKTRTMTKAQRRELDQLKVKHEGRVTLAASR